MDNLKTWPARVCLVDFDTLTMDAPSKFDVTHDIRVWYEKHANDTVEYIRADLVPKINEISDDEIFRIEEDYGITDLHYENQREDFIAFVRAIEAKIRGEKMAELSGDEINTITDLFLEYGAIRGDDIVPFVRAIESKIRGEK